MQRFSYALTIAIVVAATGLAFVPLQTAHAMTGGADCSQGTTTISVNNTEELIVAPEGESWGNTSIGPIDVQVPSGTYSVSYSSFDDHLGSGPESGDHSQSEERWYFDGYFEGEKVFTSSPTDDVAADADYQTGFLEVDTSVPALDAVVIRHIQEVDTDGGLPQSVIPSCIGFTPSEACDAVVGYVADANGDCVCQGDYVPGEGGNADVTPPPCECPEGSVATGEGSSHSCTVCTGDLEAQPSKTSCECPEGTALDDDSTDTCIAAEQQQGVLGAATTVSSSSQGTEAETEATPQVLGAATAGLAATGQNQLLMFGTGGLILTGALLLMRKQRAHYKK